jgi:glycosyltransferase involved in cell wall biosynthesis
MSPFFSIVIPAYNRATMIGAALESVLEQTVRDYEVMVVDDGSTDDTVAVATQFAAKFSQPIKVLTQANAGPGVARNTGIRNSTGQYVAFLDSDDLWFPWTLSLFQKAIAEFNQPAFLCGLPIDVRVGDVVNADGNQPMTVEQYADFYSVPGNPFYRFTTSGVAVQKSSLDKVNGFATEGFEDLDLWMRLGTEPGFLLISNPPIVVRRLFGINLSESRKYNRSGTDFMIASEKTGRYPGGHQRQADRRRLLTVLMRAASVQMARSRDTRAAVSVYFKIFFWSVAQFRFRYILGLPLQIISGMIGKRP